MSMTVNQLNALMAATTKRLKPCPLCDAPAIMFTADYLTIMVVCADMACRCKVERGAVNCSLSTLIDEVKKVWNKRP